MRRLLRGFRVLFFIAVAVEAFLIISFRFKVPAMLDFIKRFNRNVLNPIMLDYAGTHGFYASALHHLGRKTGTPYSTPVYATPIPDGFIIPLSYGTDMDWLKNVMADGTARLDFHGVSHHTESPEIIPASVAESYIPRALYNRMRYYGIDYFLQLKASTSPA